MPLYVPTAEYPPGVECPGAHTWPVLVTSPITPDPPGNKINEDLCLTFPGPPMTSLRLNTNLS